MSIEDLIEKRNEVEEKYTKLLNLVNTNPSNYMQLAKRGEARVEINDSRLDALASLLLDELKTELDGFNDALDKAYRYLENKGLVYEKPK